MKQFDYIFENAMLSLIKEQAANDLEFNIRTLVLKLQDPINNYVGEDETADNIVKKVLLNKNVLDIGADKLNFLPKIRLQFSQTSGVEDFNVEATVLGNENNAISEKSKKFSGNQSPESICDDVVAYLDKVKMESGTGDNAVKNAPAENNPGNAQPGAESTALPTAATGTPPATEAPTV